MTDQLPEITLLAEGFGLCAHRNQRRKFEDAPYMVHPIRVARIVQEYTDDPDVIAAAMMHDVLEDTDVTAEEMRRVFGDTITDLVLDVTDVSRPSDGVRQVRKDKDREHLAKSSPGGATIKLADLIDNAIGIAANDKGFAPVYLPGGRADSSGAETWRCEVVGKDARDACVGEQYVQPNAPGEALETPESGIQPQLVISAFVAVWAYGAPGIKIDCIDILFHTEGLWFPSAVPV